MKSLTIFWKVRKFDYIDFYDFLDVVLKNKNKPPKFDFKVTIGRRKTSLKTPISNRHYFEVDKVDLCDSETKMTGLKNFLEFDH